MEVPIKGPYTRGRKMQMTAEWKEQVRAALAEQRWSHQRLEDHLKAGRGQISRMLKPDQNTSVWVAKVSEALRLPMPGQESPDEATLLANFRAATDEGKRALLQHAAAAAGVAGRSDN
jgi:hypothetical protein